MHGPDNLLSPPAYGAVWPLLYLLMRAAGAGGYDDYDKCVGAARRRRPWRMARDRSVALSVVGAEGQRRVCWTD